MPIALAVLRLTTSSNFVGSSKPAELPVELPTKFELGWLGALQRLGDHAGELMIAVVDVGTVAHQSAAAGKVGEQCDRRKAALQGELGKWFRAAAHERGGQHH